jgi:hypothetical protein
MRCNLETLLNKYHLRRGFANQDQGILRLILGRMMITF